MQASLAVVCVQLDIPFIASRHFPQWFPIFLFLSLYLPPSSPFLYVSLFVTAISLCFFFFGRRFDMVLLCQSRSRRRSRRSHPWTGRDLGKIPSVQSRIDKHRQHSGPIRPSSLPAARLRPQRRWNRPPGPSPRWQVTLHFVLLLARPGLFPSRRPRALGYAARAFLFYVVNSWD